MKYTYHFTEKVYSFAIFTNPTCITQFSALKHDTVLRINKRWLYKIARSHWLAISDYQPMITSMDKMAASSRFATVSEDDFALKCFFFSFLK